MTRPTRDTLSGRVYLDLRALARRSVRPMQELVVIYVLERFLHRLAVSPYRDRLVLKGGLLLAALDTRRPTADIDLLAERLSNDRERIVRVVLEILAVRARDGVTFQADDLTAWVIRDQELYAGVRLSVPARVDRAQTVLRVDVNFGDPVTPGPVEVEYPTLLQGSVTLLGYPVATVLAEKIVTMVDRGAATTRERDFADVVLLARRHAVDATTLRAAIDATAAHRESSPRRLQGLLDGLGSSRRASWIAYLARSGLADQLPAAYDEAIAEVIRFADPILDGTVTSGAWDPMALRWR